ncbi:hypothetical protein Clacol_001706 [Clathrus columnatus]|uniref:Uncharacterized protein n=1 Tax=Clathrus columnatus TaxID=1419009 RepID=A0AAV5A2K6_9AGAM|nr:hypothetical protein Clacol_001706 [Clathrus columnatus]
MEDTQSYLLSLIEKQGQEFLSQFPDLNSSTKQTTLKSKLKKPPTPRNDVDEEEWLGFSDIYDGTLRTSENKGKEPEIVVFDHAISGVTPIQHKELFMSSKISKLKGTRSEDKLEEQVDEKLEESNIRNDAILHRLIHTELLSGSLKNDFASSSAAQRRKALAGRVLELSGDVKLGKGEASVRQEERQHASKSAKEMGNYHPSLRKIFSGDKNITRKKRERGLSMGVGRFAGGVLKLSKHEIQSVQREQSTQSSKWRRKSKGKP